MRGYGVRQVLYAPKHVGDPTFDQRHARTRVKGHTETDFKHHHFLSFVPDRPVFGVRVIPFANKQLARARIKFCHWNQGLRRVALF